MWNAHDVRLFSIYTFHKLCTHWILYMNLYAQTQNLQGFQWNSSIQHSRHLVPFSPKRNVKLLTHIQVWNKNNFFLTTPQILESGHKNHFRFHLKYFHTLFKILKWWEISPKLEGKFEKSTLEFGRYFLFPKCCRKPEGALPNLALKMVEF